MFLTPLLRFYRYSTVRLSDYTFVFFCFLAGDSLSTTKISGDFESSKDTSHYSTLEGDLDDSFFSRYVLFFASLD